MTSNSETAATAATAQYFKTCWLGAALNIFKLLAIACGLHALNEGQYVHHIPYSLAFFLSLSLSRCQACTLCRDWYHSLLNESFDLISHCGSQEKSTSTDKYWCISSERAPSAQFHMVDHSLPNLNHKVGYRTPHSVNLEYSASEPDWSIRSACSHNRSLRPSICPHMGSLHPVADGLSALCQSSWNQLLQDKCCRSCSVWSNKDLIRNKMEQV